MSGGEVQRNQGLNRTAGIGGLLVYVLVGLLPAVTGLPIATAWWVVWAAGLPFFAVEMLVDLPHRATAWLLLPMSAVGIAMYIVEPLYGFGGVPMVITAAAAGLVLPLWPAVGVMAVQTAVVLGSAITAGDGTSALAITFYGGLQVFAVMTGQIAQRETAAREEISRVHHDLSVAHEELRRAHADLEAAQARLAETSRTDERLRISRDLHDLVGHQLSALAVNLEVASHLAEGPAAETVTRCRTIARDLLTDVRGVVSRLRDEPAPDLRHALTDMAAAFPRPVVHLDVAPDLPSLGPGLTDTLVRCVQEVLTNAVRHSGAPNVWVTVTARDGVVRVRARDDGRGAPAIRPNNGLTGMRERVTALGGTLTIDGREGFRVDLDVPLGGGGT